MTLKLALFEAAAIIGVVCAVVLWSAGQAPDGPNLSVVAVHGLAIALCAIAAFYYQDLYDLRRVRTFEQSARRLPRAAAVGGALALAGHAPFVDCPLAGGPLLVSGVAALGLVMLVRAGAYRLMTTTPGFERVLVIGAGALAQELIAEIEARPHLRQTVIGFVDDRSVPPLPGCPRLGSLGELARVIGEARPQRAIVALASRRGSMPLKVLLDLRVSGTAVEDGAEVYERLTGKIAIEALTPTSLIFSKHYRIRRLDLTLTRILSLPVIAVLLLLLAPLFVVMALAIKLDSRGPVLVVQERVGLRGRRFKLVKFRTMYPLDGELPLWFGNSGDRITRVGRWLRRFRLDELPQLINIMQGEMSLVGPRPQRVSKFELLAMVARNAPDCGEQIPYCAVRSLVRPGMTGWAQVRYSYAHDLEEEIEKMRYDLYYIKHRSPWLDLRILVETVKIILGGREAAVRKPAAATAATRPARQTLRIAAATTPRPADRARAPQGIRPQMNGEAR